jgi:hypothetical protein
VRHLLKSFESEMMVRREIGERIAKHKKRANSHDVRPNRQQIRQSSANSGASADDIIYDCNAFPFDSRVQRLRHMVFDGE